MIRVATQEDFEIVSKLVEGLIEDSVYSKLFKDYKLTHEMYRLYTTKLSEKIFVLSLDKDNNVIGFSGFDIIPWLYCDAPVRIARLAYIYLKPEFRGKGYAKEIKVAFEHWGKTVGAQFYSTAHKYEGYKEVETIYMKEIK